MIKYNVGSGKQKNWILSEEEFNQNNLGKCESIMMLGNGYLGLRSATEESYRGEVRNLFVSGTFNKFDEGEVTELPNLADLINIEFYLNNERFDLTQGTLKSYRRFLNIKDAELNREIVWVSPKGDEVSLTFKRFVSLKNLHLIGQKIEIKPLNNDIELRFQSGINGQMTNSGVQHFSEGEKRLFDQKIMQLIQTTTQSNVDIVINSVHNFKLNNEDTEIDSLILMDRRKIFNDYHTSLGKDDVFTIEKISNIYTSRDRTYVNTEYSLDSLREESLENIKNEANLGYDQLSKINKETWEERIWNQYGVTIKSDNDVDQLAIRFSIYHLNVMTPGHDNRMNIGAKGLSGEGYKGHTFWDTEIFVLPFWIYNNPDIARSLLEYRYLSLPGAHKKAEENGYEGAMFPWESAWLDDGEVTPVYGAADIITGKPTKIWSGFIEQHITSDVALGVWQYYQITNDQDFMDRYGYELLLDTAKFWQSRLEYEESKDEYHINDVVGPDEYKEHVNNNAFTNYTAHWTIKNAINYYNELKLNKPKIFERLNEKLDLDDTYHKWVDKVDKIYLPEPREDLVIPQDDTYLNKKQIDLTKYKNQENVGTIFKDYNLEQVNDIQVSKQADIMILFYLLENLFSKDVKKANWDYYEPKTLHDSSLSLSTHCVLASDLEDSELAYDLFKKAIFIDMGPNMKTSDAGIHAASLGGIWQSVVLGFGGVRMVDGRLRINPRLPKEWSELSYQINWKGDTLHVTITGDRVTIKNETLNNEVLEVEICDEIKEIKSELQIKL